jgi:hypothetical protein
VRRVGVLAGRCVLAGLLRSRPGSEHPREPQVEERVEGRSLRLPRPTPLSSPARVMRNNPGTPCYLVR